MVMARQLGQTAFDRYAAAAQFPDANVSVALQNPECSGDELAIHACTEDTMSDCDAENDIGIICNNSKAKFCIFNFCIIVIVISFILFSDKNLH